MENELYINMDTFLYQLKNNAMIEMASALCPDEDSKNIITALLSVFVRHGISVEKAMPIIVDMAKEFEDKNN